MSINLETLVRQTVPTWTYGTTIAGATLSTILNSVTDDVDVTGVLQFNGEWILDNPTLSMRFSNGGKITGTYINFTASGKVTIKRFALLDGPTAITPSTFGFHQNAQTSGIIRNVGLLETVYGGPLQVNLSLTNYVGLVRADIQAALPNLDGLLFENIAGGHYNIGGAVDNVTFRNLTGTCGTSTNNGVLGNGVSGSNIVWDGCHFTGNIFELTDPRYVDPDGPNVYDTAPVCIKSSPAGAYRSIKNQVIRNCTLEGASEETTGFDCLVNSVRSFGSITDVSALASGRVVMQEIYGTPHQVGETPPAALSGNQSLGQHLLIMSGPLRGNYYEIVAQADNVLTLDTSEFPLTGLQAGTKVSIHLAYVGNKYYDNHIIGWADYHPVGYWGGISLWGSCFGNHIFRNTVEWQGAADYTKWGAVSDQGVIETRNGYAPKVNSKNKVYDNIAINCGYETQTRLYNIDDIITPVTDDPNGAIGIGPLFLDNSGSPALYTSVVAVEHSSTQTPFITDIFCNPVSAASSPVTFASALNRYGIGGIVGNTAYGWKLAGHKVSLVSGATSAVITQDVHDGITWSATLTGYTGNLVMAANPSDEITVIPKVIRKLRSPSGGKIRGKGAGKVSGKPQ